MSLDEGGIKPFAVHLLAITDRRCLGERRLEDWAASLVAAGIDAVQIREKDLEIDELIDLARALRRLLAGQIAVLVNSSMEVALAAGCQGVHLPARSEPIEALRRRAGKKLWIGKSTHHPREVEAAKAAGADYVTFGPVYPTPSKEIYGPPPGIPGLRQATAVGIPVLALGGVSPERLAETHAAGAAGVAGIRMFYDAVQLNRAAEIGRRLWPENPRAASL